MNSKTKFCKVCSKEVAKSAKSCPNCGAKIKKPIYKRIWFIVLILIIIVGAIGMTGSDEPDLSNVEYTPYTVDEMIADLDKNPANASEKYKDTYVELTGRLNVVDSSGSYISIYSLDNEWDLKGVQCFIQNDEQLKKVKSMSIGEEVTIRGKITDVGEVMGYSLDITEIK